MKRPSKPGHRRSIPPAYDVRRLVAQRVDKRGRKLQAFETRAAADRERQLRVRRLRSSGSSKAISLARVLKRCRRGHRCHSNACPVCGRLRRIDDSAAILKYLEHYPLGELRFLTLVNPNDARRAGRLHTFDPVKAKNRTRRQFERAGIDKSKVAIIGGIDGEWDEGWGLFQPHQHAAVRGLSKGGWNRLLKKVVKKWPRAKGRVRARKRLEPIDDLPRIVAYL